MSFWSSIGSGLKSIFFPTKYAGDNQINIAAANRQQTSESAKYASDTQASIAAANRQQSDEVARKARESAERVAAHNRQHAEELAVKAREHAQKLQAENQAFTEKLRRFELEEQRKIQQERMAFDRDLLEVRMAHEKAQLELGFTYNLLLEAERAMNQRQAQVFQQALNNFPLSGTTPLSVLESYKVFRETDSSLPFLVIVSPPEVNFERVPSAPSGLPKMETELSESLRTFLEKYYPMTDKQRPVRFLGGAWNSKSARGEAAFDSICTVFAEVPLLILESEVGADLKMNLRLLARDIGQTHTQAKSILSGFEGQAFIDRLAKAEALQWREQREKFVASGKLGELKKKSKNIQTKETNVETLVLEEETGESLGYVPTESVHQELKRFLGTLHCLLTGMVSDEFFLAHYRVMPQLPHLLPELLLGFSPEETAEVVEIIRTHYQEMAMGLLSQRSPYAPFLALDVAMGLSQLPDKTFALQQLQSAAEIFLAQQGQQVSLVEEKPNEMQWLETVLSYCSAADERFLSALYACFAQVGSNQAKLLISDRKEALRQEEQRKLSAEQERQKQLAYQQFLAEQQAKAERERLEKEKGVPVTFSTVKAGKKETVTVYEKTFNIKGTQLVMVYIPEGDWKQGNKPLHLKPFYLGKFPVTQRQYQAVMGENPSSFKGSDNLPVESVSWLNAVEFCKKLSQLVGKTFRLPTEAEWEYAARAGTTTEYWWGDSMDNKHCWYDGNSEDKTHPVDEKVNEHTNPFGLCDILGNVWEWTHSDYASSYDGSERLCSEDSNKNKSLRGGSWFTNSYICRVASRNYLTPVLWNGHFGFRVLLVLP